MNTCFSWITKIPRKVLAGTGILVGVAAIAVAWSGGLKIQTDINLKSIEKIGDLCLLKVFDTYIITNEVNGVSGTFVAPCDAILKLDFSKIGIAGTNGHYSVSFPPITVSQPRVDREDNSFRTFEVSKNVTALLHSSDPLRKAAMDEADRRIEREALSSRFVGAAKAQATNIVSSLIRRGSGRNDITFEWHWPDEGAGQEEGSTPPLQRSSEDSDKTHGK